MALPSQWEGKSKQTHVGVALLCEVEVSDTNEMSSSSASNTVVSARVIGSCGEMGCMVFSLIHLLLFESLLTKQ